MIPGYSDRGGTENDTNSEEEAGLQEAIRRSLSHDQTTPTPSAPPPLDRHEDEDVQRAVEQSIADMHHADTANPPPYNPSCSWRGVGEQAASDIQERGTVMVGESNREASSDMRRRGTGGASSGTHPRGDVQHPTRTHNMDIDSVRAARLRRFSGMT